jgi:hypothetical protein
MTTIGRSNTEFLRNISTAPAAQGAVMVDLSAVRLRMDRIKSFGRTALAITLIVAVVTAIVGIKFAIWLPRFHP